MSRKRTRDNVNKPKHDRFHLNTEKHLFTVQVTVSADFLKTLRSLPLLRYLRTIWTWSWDSGSR